MCKFISNNIILKRNEIIVRIAIVILIIVMTSCTEPPFGGAAQIYSKTKEESKERQMFLCSYIPLDTVFEYHDSLIDIKLTIIEAYAENRLWQKLRWPPYIIPRYSIAPDSYIFHCLFKIDSSSTQTDEYNDVDDDWWMFTDFVQNSNEFWCYDGQLFKDVRMNTIDTMDFPIYFGRSYRDKVWPGSENEMVPIGFIRFVMDTNDCDAIIPIKGIVMNTAKEELRACVEDYHCEWNVPSLNWYTVDEMNQKYKKQ